MTELSKYIPSKESFTGDNVTEGGFKTALEELLDILTREFPTDSTGVQLDSSFINDNSGLLPKAIHRIDETIKDIQLKLSTVQSAAAVAVDQSWQKVYPVGSIFITTATTNPSTWFNGSSWVELESGLLLMSCGTSGKGSRTPEGNNTININVQEANNGENNKIIGPTSLSTNHIPAHTHTGTTSNDKHSHDKGSMNITGYADLARRGAEYRDKTDGALSYGSSFSVGIKSGNSDSWGSRLTLNAKDGWTGNTSENTHNHTFTTSSVGKGIGHSHSFNLNTDVTINPLHIPVHIWVRTK